MSGGTVQKLHQFPAGGLHTVCLRLKFQAFQNGVPQEMVSTVPIAVEGYIKDSSGVLVEILFAGVSLMRNPAEGCCFAHAAAAQKEYGRFLTAGSNTAKIDPASVFLFHFDGIESGVIPDVLKSGVFPHQGNETRASILPQ